MFKEIIDERLKELIPSPKTSLYESTRYALLSPGKRFRPSLVMAVAASLGADPKIALDPACAIEMVHTYSLIHDDLPCMDNDDLRRGRPTLHKAFDEGLALLTGDYLLTYSFEILSNTAVLSTSQKLQMIQILSHAAGSHGMIGGQAIDLDMTGKSIDEATLYEMHHGKTSALFIAALKFGAIIANGSTSTFHDLGSDLGLAFQFLDDLLDATSNQETLGKKIGGDKEKGKQTAISLYGIEGTIQKLKTLKGKIEHKTIQFPALSTLLQQNLWNRFLLIG